MPDDDYAERLARGDWRAYLHEYGHPGALERVASERDDRACLAVESLRENTALRAEVERLTKELRHTKGAEVAARRRAERLAGDLGRLRGALTEGEGGES